MRNILTSFLIFCTHSKNSSPMSNVTITFLEMKDDNNYRKYSFRFACHFPGIQYILPRAGNRARKQEN